MVTGTQSHIVHNREYALNLLLTINIRDIAVSGVTYAYRLRNKAFLTQFAYEREQFNKKMLFVPKRPQAINFLVLHPKIIILSCEVWFVMTDSYQIVVKALEMVFYALRMPFYLTIFF